MQWTTLDRVATLPGGTGVAIATRTSANGTTWTPFVAVSGATIASPPNRYLQYRATLTTSAPGVTPALESVTVNAAPDTVAPVTAIYSPAADASLRGSAVLAGAAASDNAGVTALDYRVTGGAVNDVVIGTGGLTIYGWLAYLNTTAVPDGTYTLQSVARDAAGNVGRSAGITIKIDNTAPTNALVIPANGASVRGNAVVLDAIAGDNVAVTRVEFRATGGSLVERVDRHRRQHDLRMDRRCGTPTRSRRARTRCRASRSTRPGNSTTSAPITITVDRTAPTTA